MNGNTHTPRTSTSVRRAVPALAIVALAVGLGACQTPPRGQAALEAQVIQQVQEPVQVGLDRTRPADRIAEAIERRAAREAVNDRLGSWTDRVTAQLEHQAKLSQSPSVRFRGMSADRIEEQLAREADRFDGMSADRIVEKLEREPAGAPKYY